MARFYMGKKIVDQGGPKHLNVVLPRGWSTARYRWRRRQKLLQVRYTIEICMSNLPSLQTSLQEILNNFFGRNASLTSNETFTSPDGKTYYPGDKAFWVPDFGHMPNGVCPYCSWIASTFSRGGDPRTLYAFATDARHIALHTTSAVHNIDTGCHCRIMSGKEYGDIESSNKTTDNAEGGMDYNFADAIRKAVYSYCIAAFEEARQRSAMKISEEIARWNAKMQTKRAEVSP